MKGKVAIVTGGATGIGRATAIALARRGVSVIIGDTNEGKASETVASIQNDGGIASYKPTDVSDMAQASELVQYAVSEHGQLDIAFNNAGINRNTPLPFAETPDDEWDRILSINLNGVRNCMKCEIQQMLSQGTGGSIVNTSSVWGVVGFAGFAPYVASKHAIAGLTKAAALENIQHGIRINAVNPGPIDTAMPKAFFDEVPEAREAIEEATPIGRMGRAEEVADAVVWLCSTESSYVVGHLLMVDGGATVQ